MVTAVVLGGLPPRAGLQEQTISLSRKMNGGIFVFSSLGTVLKHTGNSKRDCSDYPSHLDSSALLYAVFPVPLLILRVTYTWWGAADTKTLPSNSSARFSQEQDET